MAPHLVEVLHFNPAILFGCNALWRISCVNWHHVGIKGTSRKKFHFRKVITLEPQGFCTTRQLRTQRSHNHGRLFPAKNTLKVFAIILYGLHLEGSISPSLGSLSLLWTFQLWEKCLIGRIPP